MTRVAIIGAGLSGLTLAHKLQKVADVTIFERSALPGGRMASRTVGTLTFDHGAQFFFAKSTGFKQFLAPLLSQNIVARWDAAFAEFVGPDIINHRQWDADFAHYVGVPDMNALPRALAATLTIHYSANITKIDKPQQRWRLWQDEHPITEQFDWLISTLPAEQSAALLRPHSDLLSDLPDNLMQPCYALMLGFSKPQQYDWQAAHVREADISWMSVNSSKPERNLPFTMLVLATNAWSVKNFDLPLHEAEQHLINETVRIAGIDAQQIVHRDCKRWTYVNLPKQRGNQAYIDAKQQLAACGDWCIHGRVEAAYTSATSLAEKLISDVLR